MSRGIARQMAQYSEAQQVLVKSDMLLSARTPVNLLPPLFLGLQTILDHKFPATLVPTAIIAQQISDLAKKAAQHKLSLLFSDPSFVSQADTEFFTTGTQIKIVINLPLLAPPHNRQYDLIQIPQTFINIKKSVWLLKSTDLVIRDTVTNEILTSVHPQDILSCPIQRSIRVCRRPTIKPRSSCTADLLSNSPDTSSCLSLLSIPSDPYEFISNHTLHHFSTQPTPYTLHCPGSSQAAALTGLSSLKIPPHCQFKSSALLHHNHPDITQAFDIPSKDLLSKPDVTNNLLAHLTLHRPHDDLERFWNKTMDKIQTLSAQENSLPSIQDLIHSQSFWNRTKTLLSKYSAFLPLPVLLAIILLALCLCHRFRRHSASLGHTLSQLSANSAAAQQLATFR